MQVPAQEEPIGVICDICHKEAFQIFKRMANIEVKCCPQCTRALDTKTTIQEGTKALDKAERKEVLKQASHDWAQSLHGKEVVIYWDRTLHPIYTTPRSPYHAKGTAQRYPYNACGGWGQVIITLDKSENHRVQLIYGSPTGKTHPVIDNQQYGLFLNQAEDGSFYSIVSWGSHKSLALASSSITQET